MLRVKIPVGNEKWEAEGTDESQLEASLRVLLRAVDSRKQPSALNQVGGVIANWLTQQPDARVDVAKPVPPPGYKPPLYKKLEKDTNRERFRLALADLMLNFGRQGASANEIIRHLEATGGKYESNSKDRAASARQMMRSDDYMESTDSGWCLVDEAVLKYIPFAWRDSNLDEDASISGKDESDREIAVEEPTLDGEVPDDQTLLGTLVPSSS